MISMKNQMEMHLSKGSPPRERLKKVLLSIIPAIINGEYNFTDERDIMANSLKGVRKGQLLRILRNRKKLKNDIAKHKTRNNFREELTICLIQLKNDGFIRDKNFYFNEKKVPFLALISKRA